MAYTTIDKPTDYFNTVLYTGNGSTQSITGVNFQPDWVWIKNRAVVSNHNIYDAIRGVQKPMYANATNAESTVSTGLTSFDTDGFSVGSNADHNGNTQGHVAWNWLGANGTASNTDGSITSTVSANTTAGFSIVSYTGNGSAGATIGHSLGQKPDWMIVKNRDSANHFMVYHSSLGATKHILLNETDAAASFTVTWNDTEPTSSVFSVGTSFGTNKSGDNYIGYCFTEKKGYSKFGSYTGNGNADGTFIYTGFKPAMVIYKNSSSVYDWIIEDNKRSAFNLTDDILYPNTDGAEDTGSGVDFLSQGVKLRSTANKTNRSGDTYIYMAFAENPFVTGASGIPCTAR